MTFSSRGSLSPHSKGGSVHTHTTPAASEASCPAPHSDRGTQEGSHYYGPHAGRGTRAGSCYHQAQAALQAPGQILHSPSTARAELGNASHSGIPTVLWRRVITLQDAISPITSRIYIFFLNLISSNFSTLGYKNTALQRHITNSNCL